MEELARILEEGHPDCFTRSLKFLTEPWSPTSSAYRHSNCSTRQEYAPPAGWQSTESSTAVFFTGMLLQIFGGYAFIKYLIRK